MLLSQVLDDDGIKKDVIRNYRVITINNVLRFNNTYLGNGTHELPNADRVLPDLDPASNDDDKVKFYLRVRSQMIAQGVEGIIDSDSWTELMNKKKHFTWYTSTGDEYFDRAMMVKLCMDTCNPETKVTIQMLRSKISGTKSAEFHYKITKMLDHISSAMNLITELSEIYDSLLKNIFDALLTAPNSRFHQFFEIEKTHW